MKKMQQVGRARVELSPRGLSKPKSPSTRLFATCPLIHLVQAVRCSGDSGDTFPAVLRLLCQVFE